MDMSGTDFVFELPARLSAVDVVLRACRAVWPCCVLEHVEEEEIRPIDDPSLWSIEESVNEFFVYRGSDDAADWTRNGSTTANAATMIHVMIGTSDVPDTAVCVLEVHDPSDPRVLAILNRIDAAISDAREIQLERAA